MLFTELMNHAAKELQRMLEEEKKRLFELRLKVRANQLKQVRDVRTTRTKIARINTALRVKQAR